MKQRQVPAALVHRMHRHAAPHSMFHPTSASGTPTLPSLGGEAPLYIRRTLEAMCPVETFKVAGVTFEGRQVSTTDNRGEERDVKD